MNTVWTILKITGIILLVLIIGALIGAIAILGGVIGAAVTTIKVIVALITKNGVFIKRFLWWSIIKSAILKLGVLIGLLITLISKTKGGEKTA